MDATNTHELPKLESIEQVSNGWINKYILTYTLPSGSEFSYEAASRKGLDEYRAELEANACGRPAPSDAVCIVPETPDGKLLLIQEFRYPLNTWCIAFPAGLMEPDEDIATCVDRELREETGYRLRRDVPSPIHALPQPGFSSTGLTDETVQVVFAQVEKAGAATPEANELICPFTLPKEDVRAFLHDDKTFIGTRAQLILELIAAKEELAK